MWRIKGKWEEEEQKKVQKGDISGRGKEVILCMRNRQVELYAENEILKQDNASLMLEMEDLRVENLCHKTEIKALAVEKRIELKKKIWRDYVTKQESPGEI